MSIELAQNIVSVSKKRNISIKELERQAGLYDGYFRKVRSGSITNINISKLTKVAKILGVPLDSLVGSVISTVDKNKLVLFNKKLFEKVNKFVLEYMSDYTNTEFSLKIFDVVSEIYLYSIDNNNGDLDKNFAKFLLDKYLKQSY